MASRSGFDCETRRFEENQRILLLAHFENVYLRVVGLNVPQCVDAMGVRD